MGRRFARHEGVRPRALHGGRNRATRSSSCATSSRSADSATAATIGSRAAPCRPPWRRARSRAQRVQLLQTLLQRDPRGEQPGAMTPDPRHRTKHRRRYGTQFASDSRKTSSSHRISARQTRPTAEGSTSDFDGDRRRRSPAADRCRRPPQAPGRPVARRAHPRPSRAGFRTSSPPCATGHALACVRQQ